MGQTFNRLFKFQKINMCEGWANPPLFVKDFVPACKRRYPRICSKCPPPTGPLFINFTEYISEDACPKNTYKNIPNLGGSIFPDGDYRTTIKMYSRDDSEIFRLIYFYRINTGDGKAF